MIVIFEGCDCTGKTSLINEFKKYVPEPLVIKHFSAPPKNMSQRDQHDYCMIEYYTEIALQQNFPNINFLYDRFYFGEQIYAPRFRGYHPQYISNLEKRLNDLNAYLVLVTASADVVMKRFDGNFIKKNDIPDLLFEFAELFDYSNIKNKLLVNTTRYSSKELASALWGKINAIH